MLRVRANFLSYLESFLGKRPATITRKELMAVVDSYNNGIGPYGLLLRWPSWLTSNPDFRNSRGSYNLPWEDLEIYENEVKAKVEASTVKA